MARSSPAQTVVLASGNSGKLREFQRLFAPLPLTLEPQGKFAVPEVEETGLTFVENAIIKARAAAAHSGLPAIADDSGLEVEYLAGAPGIHSARYSGEGDTANNAKLLEALSGVPEAGRGARFGYDPLFYVPECGCSSAELPAQEKNRISHRAQACAQLFRALQTQS